MLHVPRWGIALGTAPGVVTHEAAQLFFCRLQRIAVFEVRYFQFGKDKGHIVHEPCDFASSLVLVAGPMAVSAILCLLFCMPAQAAHILGKTDGSWLLLTWLGLSIAVQAFPSYQEAAALWRQAKQAARAIHPIAVISLPFVLFIYIVMWCQVFYVDYILGLLFALLVPEFLFHLIA
jgi:hypothetical protein